MPVFSGRAGYALVEPEPRDLGPGVDDVPPATGGVAAYQRWRAKVEADLAGRIERGELKVWVPIKLPAQAVVPLFGGAPVHDWFETVVTLLKVASDEDATVRVVDLTSLLAPPLDRQLQRFPGYYAFAELARGGSLDATGALDTVGGLVSMLSEVLRADDDRSGRNASAAAQNLLRLVLDALDDGEVSIARAKSAVECALHAQPSRAGILHPAEENRLINHAHARLQQNQVLWNNLFEIDAILALLEPFEPRSAPRTSRGRRGRGSVSLLGLGQGPTAERETALDLLSARCLSDLRERPADLTILLGGDHVAPRLLDAMADAVESAGSRLFVFFERLTDGTQQRLGWRGGNVAGFFRLANNTDATHAAEFLGRQHRFVLSGWSESRSRSVEWGWNIATTQGTDRSTSRAWGIGSGFSRTVSQAHSRSRSEGHSGGRSISTSTSTNHERVYEYLIEPAVFQGLGEGAMLLVDTATRSARLASSSRAVTRSVLVDWGSTVAICDG